ncbi:MAG TPA: PilZ domain-containing protein [Rhodanobacter sp.]
MSTAASSNQRRAKRKRVTITVVVTDVITGLPMGHLGNLSSSGMLLISSVPPRDAAIYQVSMPLPEPGRAPTASQPVEVGIQEQWHEPAASPGQFWAGYRIVAIADADAERLEAWLARA